MARGLDKEKKGGTPPRRNPFRQEIKNQEEIEKIKREAEARKPVSEPVVAAAQEAPEKTPASTALPTNADPDRARLLHGLPLNILDPLSRSQGFEHILDPNQAEDLNHTYLRSEFELVSWREAGRDNYDPLEGYAAILYKREEPVALVIYDELDESFVLYGQDPISGQAQEIISLSTLEQGFLGRWKKKRGYEQNTSRALAQEINDFLGAVELGELIEDNPFPDQGTNLYPPAMIAAGLVLSASRINMPHDN